MNTRAQNPESIQTRAAKGGLVSGVGFAVNLGLNLVQVPLLLRFWPQETYGLWLGVGALATLLTSLDGGHQAYVGNLLSRQYVEDRAAFRTTFASAVRIASLTSGLQILLVIGISLSGGTARWLDIGARHAFEFSLAVVIYTVGWISTGSVGAILVRLFPPTGYFVRSTWWAIAARVVQFAAVGMAAWLGWGLVGTALLLAGAVFLYNVLLFADIYRLFPDLFPWWRGGHFKLGLTNFLRSNVLTGVSLLDMFSLQGVVLLVTGTLGAAAVPLFTTLRTLANTAMQGTGFLLNPIQPDLVRYHVKREGQKIGAVFDFFWLTTGAAINGGMIAGLFLVEPVYAYWTRGKLTFDRPLFGWLAAAVLVRTLAAPMQNYLLAINAVRALFVVALVRAVLTIGGFLVLAPRWGLAGAGAALFAAELVGSLILPWWLADRALADIGSRVGWLAPGLAVASTACAGAAIVSYTLAASFWPALAGLMLACQVMVAGWQWRSTPLDVRARVNSVLRSVAGMGRSRAPAR